MSDSLLDLTAGGLLPSTVFTIKPCWSTRPSVELPQSGREMMQYDRATMRYRKLTTNIGWKVTMGFSTISKAELFNILKFFETQKAMCSRFWLPVRWNYFTLYESIVSGSKDFKINEASFVDIVRGIERVFILLKNGDLITRQIVTAYTVFSAWDRNIAQTDIDIMGKLILCRFDQDEIEVQHITTDLSEIELTFQELGQEYISE